MPAPTPILRPRRDLRQRLGMGVVAMGGVDAAPAARRNRQSDPNRTMADGDLSRTHLQVACEGRCRRSHVKLERWPAPVVREMRESRGGRTKGGAGHLLRASPRPFFPFSLGFNRSRA